MALQILILIFVANGYLVTSVVANQPKLNSLKVHLIIFLSTITFTIRSLLHRQALVTGIGNHGYLATSLDIYKNIEYIFGLGLRKTTNVKR